MVRSDLELNFVYLCKIIKIFEIKVVFRQQFLIKTNLQSDTSPPRPMSRSEAMTSPVPEEDNEAFFNAANEEEEDGEELFGDNMEA